MLGLQALTDQFVILDSCLLSDGWPHRFPAESGLNRPRTLFESSIQGGDMMLLHEHNLYLIPLEEVTSSCNVFQYIASLDEGIDCFSGIYLERDVVSLYNLHSIENSLERFLKVQSEFERTPPIFETPNSRVRHYY